MDKKILEEGGKVVGLEVDVALAIFRGFQKDQGDIKFSYVSGPVTSGKLAYEVFDAHGVKSRQEFIDKMGQEEFVNLIKDPNVQALETLAQTVRQRGGTLVTNPGNYDVPHWSHKGAENQYLAMWEPFVAQLCSDVNFIDGWQYSTGAVLEYKKGLAALVANSGANPILLDHTGEPIDAGYGLELVTNAITEIRNRGFEVARLENAYKELQPVIQSAL